MALAQCPLCSQDVCSASLQIDSAQLEVCPDGYDTIYSDRGFPTLMPRSGKRQTVYVPGRNHFRLEPCQCPCDSFVLLDGLKQFEFIVCGQKYCGDFAPQLLAGRQHGPANN